METPSRPNIGETVPFRDGVAVVVEWLPRGLIVIQDSEGWKHLARVDSKGGIRCLTE